MAEIRSRMAPQRLDQVHASVRELLLDVGYERLTLDAVAARARCSKATLYRQWDGKAGLVIAALENDSPELRGFGAAASLDEALEAIAAGAAEPPVRQMRLAFVLLQAASRDAAFGAAVRAALLEPAIAMFAGVFEQAAERGEIARDPVLFRRLARTIITHFVFSSVFDDEPRSVESRRAFLASIVRPALTYSGRARD